LKSGALNKKARQALIIIAVGEAHGINKIREGAPSAIHIQRFYILWGATEIPLLEKAYGLIRYE
jgi:hypothetical protein